MICEYVHHVKTVFGQKEHLTSHGIKYKIT